MNDDCRHPTSWPHLRRNSHIILSAAAADSLVVLPLLRRLHFHGRSVERCSGTRRDRLSSFHPDSRAACFLHWHRTRSAPLPPAPAPQPATAALANAQLGPSAGHVAANTAWQIEDAGHVALSMRRNPTGQAAGGSAGPRAPRFAQDRDGRLVIFCPKKSMSHSRCRVPPPLLGGGRHVGLSGNGPSPIGCCRTVALEVL